MKAFVFLLLIIPISCASLSDLYDFTIERISASPSFSPIDTDANGKNDSIYSEIIFNGSRTRKVFFDITKDSLFVSHSEFNSTGARFSGTIAKVPSGDYTILLTVIEDEISLRKRFSFQAANFDPETIDALPEPKERNASFLFEDTDGDSLYDYLSIEPSGDARVYDLSGELLISGTRIDLRELYLKRAEGPFRIVVEHGGELYFATTDHISYASFERPLLSDLSLLIEGGKVVVRNSNSPAFGFSIFAYLMDEMVHHETIDYLDSGSSKELNVPLNSGLKIFVDIENSVEEENEDNNLLEYAVPPEEKAKDNSAKKESKALLKSERKEAKESEKEDKKEEKESSSSEEKSPRKTLRERAADLLKGLLPKNMLTGDAVLEPGRAENAKGAFIAFAAAALGVYLYRQVLKRA